LKQEASAGGLEPKALFDAQKFGVKSETVTESDRSLLVLAEHKKGG
jgi:hypothetical protein